MGGEIGGLSLSAVHCGVYVVRIAQLLVLVLCCGIALAIDGNALVGVVVDGRAADGGADGVFVVVRGRVSFGVVSRRIVGVDVRLAVATTPGQALEKDHSSEEEKKARKSKTCCEPPRGWVSLKVGAGRESSLARARGFEHELFRIIIVRSGWRAK